MNQTVRLVPGLLLLLAVAGCAVQRPPVASADTLWNEHRRRLQDLHDWRINGRISVQVDREAWSATLRWQQHDPDYSLQVIAPLGRGSYEISGDGNGVTLHTADDRWLHADTPEALLQDNLGWYVPVSGLQYWIRGLPWPQVPVAGLVLDEAGRLQDLRQSGWSVSYTRYADSNGYPLPRRITLQGERMRVRIVVLAWDTGP